MVARNSSTLLRASRRPFSGHRLGYLRTNVPGIVLQAVLLTFGTLATLLLAYQTGPIKADRRISNWR